MTTEALLAAATAQHSARVYVILVTVTHPGLAQPWRACNDSQDVISRGDLYAAWPFEFAEPSAEPGVEPSCRLEIDNVDRQLATILRGLPHDPLPQLRVEFVFADAPDTVDRTYPRMFIAGCDGDAARLALTIRFRSLRAEPFPFARFDGRFVSLFYQ